MSMLATRRSMSAVLWTGLFFAGCAHPTYQPYGYGYGYGPTYGPGYGPSYPATPQYLGPGTGTYVPQSITPSNSGSPTPLNSSPSKDPLNFRQNPSSPSNDAPMFNPNPNSGSKPVPNPRDPLDDLNNANPGAGASLPMGNPTTAQLPPFERGGLAAAEPPVVADILPASGTTEPDPFEEPSRLPSDFNAAPMNNGTQIDPSAYQFDGQSYQWLKGTVDYDAQTQTWSIIYNLTPDATDKYGGSFIISAHPDLGMLQSGEFALLEGSVDPRRKDQTGKPIYTVTKVTGPLTPPTR